MKHCYLFLLFLLLFYTVTLSAQTATQFTLKGYTFQKNGKARLLLYTNRNEFVPFDSVEMKNGNFFFSGTLDEPKSFMVEAGKRNRILFIGNENIIVTEKDSATGEMDVKGSPLTNDYDFYFDRWLAPLIQKLRQVNETMEHLDAAHQKEKDSLDTIQSHLFTHVPDSTVTFIREHPASFVSLYFLNYYSESYNVILLNSLFKILDNKLKKYPSADFIKQKIELGLHQSAKCPSFSLPDASGNLITLQSFHGHYLLIDFWAGWCVPCIRNLPYIQKAESQFGNKNLLILMASLDTDTAAWKTALDKYNLQENYQHIFLENQFRNPMALSFNLSFIPYNVLVDPEGNIIARNMDGDELLHMLQTTLDNATKLEQTTDNIRTTSTEPE